MADETAEVEVAGHVLQISNPNKVFFAERAETKLDLARYYVAVGDAIVPGLLDRPCVMRRFPNGAEGDSFYQKRVPKARPDWLQTVEVRFPSGNVAEELCVADAAHVVWAVNLGCIEMHPWAIRRQDLDHPDELRVDLDPQPGTTFDHVREVAALVRERLEAHGLFGVPKTSGSRGVHVFVPIEPRWTFTEVRMAALALGREVERGLPDLATTAWWKSERGEKVFVDYNQNARDRTVASAYSVRPNPDARVSCPVTWEELAVVDPASLTMATVPERLRELGDPLTALKGRRGGLDSLLERSAADAAEGLGDAPWPPYTPTRGGATSRARRSARRSDGQPADEA